MDDLTTLRNEIGSLPAVDGDYPTDDNLAIALATYFEGRLDRPEDDETDDQTGWSMWATEKTNDLLDRIAMMMNRKMLGLK